MAIVNKLISALSKTEFSDLLSIKSSLSARYLRAAAPAVALGSRALREAT